MNRAETVSTLSRVFCGITFIIYGTPKIMNLDAASHFFEGIGFPGWVAIPIAVLEFFGGFVLVAGFLTRLLASLFVIEMAVAIFRFHLPHGFEVYHLGDAMARGYGFALALVVLLVGVLILGPGEVSIDAAIARRRGAPEREPASV